MFAKEFASAKWDDAITVLRSLLSDVNEHFAAEVAVLAIWVESPQSVCVVYRRIKDTDYIWGRRLRFPPHAIDGDPQSTGSAYAEQLTEPAGSLYDTAQQDAIGVTWLLPAGALVPKSPYC